MVMMELVSNVGIRTAKAHAPTWISIAMLLDSVKMRLANRSVIHPLAIAVRTIVGLSCTRHLNKNALRNKTLSLGEI